MMIIIMLFLTFLTLKKFPFQLDILKKMTVKCEVKNGLVDSGWRGRGVISAPVSALTT